MVMALNLRRYINILLVNMYPPRLIGRKLFNLVKFILYAKSKSDRINYLPLSLDVEPTTGCNFRCTMCQVSLPTFVARNMELETFKKVISGNPQLLKIKLQGMGETLVSSQLFEMIGFARSYGVVTETTTNGSLLTDKNIKLLIANKLSKITVSIDGATKSTFEEIRVQSDFEVVVKNVRRLIAECKKNIVRPHLSAWCVLQKSNYAEIFQIYDLCRGLGFDDLTYQIQLASWGQDYWVNINKNKQINFHADQIQEDFAKIRQMASQQKFAVRIYEENALSFNKKCRWPFQSSYIATDGSVVPCAPVSDPKVVNFGNVNASSYETIWKSEAYSRLRENIRDNKLDDYCKDCYQEYR